MGCGSSKESIRPQPNGPRLSRSKERSRSEQPKFGRLTPIYNERITSSREVRDECLNSPETQLANEKYPSEENSQSPNFKGSYGPRMSAELQNLERSWQEKSAHRISLRGSEQNPDRSDDFRLRNRSMEIDDMVNISGYVESKTKDGKTRLQFTEDGTYVDAEMFMGREKNGIPNLVTQYLIRHSKCLDGPKQGELHIAIYQKLSLTNKNSLTVQPVDPTVHEARNEDCVPNANVIDETKKELVLLENQTVQSEQLVTGIELPERYPTRELSPRYIYMGVKPQRKGRYNHPCWTLPVRQPKIPVVRSRGIKQKQTPQCYQRSCRLGCIKQNATDVHSSICEYHRKDSTFDDDSLPSDSRLRLSEPMHITYKESPRENYENTRFLVEPVISRVYVAPGCSLPNVYEDIAQTVKSVHGSGKLAVDCVQQSTNSSVHTDPMLIVNPRSVEANSETNKINNPAHTRKTECAKRMESFWPENNQQTALDQKYLSGLSDNLDKPRIHPHESLKVSVLDTGTPKVVFRPSGRSSSSLYTVHTTEMNEPPIHIAVEEWTVPVLLRNATEPDVESMDSESNKEIRRTSCRYLFDGNASFRKQNTQIDNGEVKRAIRIPSSSSPVRAYCDTQVDLEQLTAPDTSSEMSSNSQRQQCQQQHRPPPDDSPTKFPPLLQSKHDCTCHRNKVDVCGTKYDTFESLEKVCPENACMTPRPLRCGRVSPVMEYGRNMVLVHKSQKKANQPPIRGQSNANSGANIKLLSTSKQPHLIERLSSQQVAHGASSRDWFNRNALSSPGFLPPIETTPTANTYHSTFNFRGPRSTKEPDKYRKSSNSLIVSVPRLHHLNSSDRHSKRDLNRTSTSISKPTEVITNSKLTGKKSANNYDMLIVHPPK
ncbi:uncharacterized protein DEA37_0001430 [Paragonimus westermani]|uniref:Uncharacterized protein n=1 Tax=Paragonimus westermani TaxID=34504 RepID=A0A5J4NJ77_9TREM|nr:uncharacterized protein DEA37_0001430 [Paragonimus westermani]